METALRASNPDVDLQRLLQELETGCRGYSFFQLAWMLQRMNPGSEEIGSTVSFAKEAIRFRSHATLAFPVADVEALEFDPDFKRMRMTVNFLGLYGPTSPLPAHYTEEIIQNDPDTHPIRQFLDLFHHRFISLYFRAWRKYRYFFVYEEGAKDYFSNWMFSLIGIGDAQLRKFSTIQWSRLLPFVHLLSMKSHSPDTLRAVLSQYFGGIDVDVEECVGKMVVVDPSQYNSIGMANATLGQNCMLGSRVFDRTSAFKVVVGPMDYEHYRYFLPQGRYHRTLRELVRFVLNDQLAFDVELRLKGGRIPQLGLHRENTCQLGGSAWLGERLVEEMVLTQVGIA